MEQTLASTRALPELSSKVPAPAADVRQRFQDSAQAGRAAVHAANAVATCKRSAALQPPNDSQERCSAMVGTLAAGNASSASAACAQQSAIAGAGTADSSGGNGAEAGSEAGAVLATGDAKGSTSLRQRSGRLPALCKGGSVGLHANAPESIQAKLDAFVAGEALDVVGAQQAVHERADTVKDSVAHGHMAAVNSSSSATNGTDDDAHGEQFEQLTEQDKDAGTRCTGHCGNKEGHRGKGDDVGPDLKALFTTPLPDSFSV